MKVVTIAAPKGGSCKSTTACLLAVRAMQDGKRVCMLDLNADQANLTQWHVARDEPDNPHLERDIQNITRDVAGLRRGGKYDWLFIDTPPLDMDVIENAVLVADAVVIPVRTSILDVGSIDAVVEMCRDHHRPYRFLLSAVDRNFKKLTASALAALAEDGDVFATRISYRLPYINAMTAGKTGPEIDDSLVDEVTTLWSEVQRLVASGRPYTEAVKAGAAND